MIPVSLSTDALSVEVLPLGATLSAVRLAGTPRNLVLGFANIEDHARVPIYAGALVGPIANRITLGRVPLDGTTYQMAQNENGVTALHSGPTGLHAQMWEVKEQSASEVTLTTTLGDGKGGLPGKRTFTARYQLREATLRLEITARTDRATPMNVAAHPYWMLDDQPTVAGHGLTVSANKYTPVDAQCLPLGTVLPTVDTPFDFAEPRPVPLDPALDVNFCLADAPRPQPVHAATLVGATGVQLDIATTAPGLQVYNGAHLPALAAALTEARDLYPYGAIALESQIWPDAPNQPNFPQITLRPGEIWHQITDYRLSPDVRLTTA